MAEAAASGDPLTEGGQFLIVVVLHRAGDGALRLRLIKLLSAGFPPSVSSSRGLVLV